jgi:zinc transporter
MTAPDSLICAFHVSPGGKVKTLGWEDLNKPQAKTGWVWIHLDRRPDATRSWLTEKSGLDIPVVNALLSATETRPRCDATKKGILLLLRGVNLNPQSKPEDMVSLRLWIEPNRVISTRRRKIMSVQELRNAFEQGDPPDTIDSFIVDLAYGLFSRLNRVVSELDEEVDDLEASSDVELASEARSKLLQLRRRAILLRRYVAPQREALSELAASRTAPFAEFQRGRLRDVSDRITRLIEELDASRERAAVIQDEVSTRLAEQMNTVMQRLSIVATIFLPLSLFTGLLGINVGGIPGTESPWAFWIVCGLLVVMTAAAIYIIKRLGSR